MLVYLPSKEVDVIIERVMFLTGLTEQQVREMMAGKEIEKPMSIVRGERVRTAESKMTSVH